MPIHKGGKKGSRKYGRNMSKCKQYRDQGRRESNKGRDLLKHLKAHPNDKVAMKALAA